MLQWFQDEILEVMTRVERSTKLPQSSGQRTYKSQYKRQNEMKLEERWGLIDAAD